MSAGRGLVPRPAGRSLYRAAMRRFPGARPRFLRTLTTHGMGLRALLVVLAVLFTAGANAQTGKLAGRIVDAATGDGLPGANILVIGSDVGSATEIDGHYMILNVRPGTYSIRASLIGFGTVIVENV